MDSGVLSVDLYKNTSSPGPDPANDPVDSILARAYSNQLKFEEASSAEQRKSLGHFGTPVKTAEFMTGLFTFVPSGEVSILDPGAGVGILALALCTRILKLEETRKIKLTLYELDKELIPYLRDSLEYAANVSTSLGYEFSYEVRHEDFILSNSFLNTLPFGGLKENPELYDFYDFIIMNPPYFKIPKNSEHAGAMKHIVHSQPNIYSLFMALGSMLLKKNGELVSITPRSFCNGPYFKNFRNYYFGKVQPYHIHIFESRGKVFRKDSVLQENIICAVRKTSIPVPITISKSHQEDFGKIEKILAGHEIVFDNSYGEQIIRIPENKNDVKLIEVLDSWPRRFKDSGYRISTGPVVSFRAKEFLSENESGPGHIPFLLMHNVRFFKTDWPLFRKNKPITFRKTELSARLILPLKNYVLLKRFSSKEEKKRLVAGVLSPNDYPDHDYIALENHLNYIYNDSGELTQEEAFGICGVLNSSFMDRYFRLINGLTQVNSREITYLPFPSPEIVKKIGADLLKEKDFSDLSRNDRIVFSHLNIPPLIQEYMGILETPIFR